jgi:hypothetical protein
MKFLSSLVVAATVLAEVPEYAQVKEHTVENGSGCSQGGVQLHLDDSKSKLTFAFDHFKAYSNHDQSIETTRRNCQVNFEVNHPQGWQYSIVKTDYQGWVNIPSGITATQRTTFYLSGQASQSTQTHTVRGPITSPFHVSDNFDNQIWSACGSGNGVRSNLNTQFRLSRSTTEWAEFGINKDNGKGVQTFQVNWRRC